MKILDEIAEQVRRCTLCRLFQSRKNAVPGEGAEDARIMLLGEAPGISEDLTGKPFVGRAGKILDSAISSASLRREMLFITNVVKCRPPLNRRPRKDEIQACSAYLRGQISIVKPRVIVTLGLTALRSFKDVRKLTFEAFDIDIISADGKKQKVRIVPTYHPAAAVRGNKNAESSLKEALSFAKKFAYPE